MQAYHALNENQRPQFADIPVRYVDYAAWHKAYLFGEDALKDKTYWMSQFQGNIPMLDLPLKQLRPEYKTFNGQHIRVEFQSQAIQGFRELLKREQGSLYMGFLSLIALAIRRFSAHDEMVLGSPVAGRNHPDLQSVLGYFSNTIALKFGLVPDDPWRHHFTKVRSVFLEGMHHAAYPFDDLVKSLLLPRDTSRSALFDILVAWEPFAPGDTGFALSGLDIQPFEHENATAKYDFDFHFRETADALVLNLDYNADMYEDSFVNKLVEAIQQILNDLLDDPDKLIAELTQTDLYQNKQTNEPTSGGFNIESKQKHPENAYADLKQLWSDLFSVNFEDLQPDADFYTLGGDSIKAIQLSSRLRKKGWKIKVSELIRHAKLAEQAKCIVPMEVQVESLPFESNVALSPIQLDFFDHINQNGIHHARSFYHQTVLLDVKGNIPVDLLKRALEILVASHDQLRVFFPDTPEGIRQELLKPDEYKLSFDVINLEGLASDEQRKEVLSQSLNLKKRFDLRYQPLFKVLYFEANPVSKLLLVI